MFIGGDQLSEYDELYCFLVFQYRYYY